MNNIAIISIILENPAQGEEQFNRIVSSHKHIVRGRMGMPIGSAGIALITIAVMGGIEEINSFVNELGRVENATVSTTVSKREIE